MKLKISDEDGFIALVNPDKYNTFVARDWNLDQLFRHFIKEMNDQNIVIWQTNNSGGGSWTVVILEYPSEKKAFREFDQTVEVTNSELCLTNYTDLTMAAQFDDEVIPAKHNSHLKINVDNGRYVILVRQMFNPDYDEDESLDVHFELIIRKNASESVNEVSDVYWSSI